MFGKLYIKYASKLLRLIPTIFNQNTHKNESCSKFEKPADHGYNSTKEAHKKVQLASNEMILCNYTAALMHYSEAIALKPDSARFLCERSGCLIALGNYELAVSDAMKAISFDGNYRKSYYIAMDCYLAMGELNKVETLITQWRTRTIATGINSVDNNQVPKLIKLKKLQADINDFLLCSNYEKALECINNFLAISTACDEFLLMKMRLHVILELPVTVKMIDCTTNKYIERITGKNFLDLLQLFYKDDLELCMKTAAKMLELLPKKFSAIDDILNKSRRFVEDFEKGLCVLKF